VTVPFIGRIRELWARLAGTCARHPPLLRQSVFADTFVVIAGLFSAESPPFYAQLPLDFARDVIESMQGGEIRVPVGVAVGGPVLCVLAGDNRHVGHHSFTSQPDEGGGPNRHLLCFHAFSF
jgi:hypothetical protein